MFPDFMKTNIFLLHGFEIPIFVHTCILNTLNVFSYYTWFFSPWICQVNTLRSFLCKSSFCNCTREYNYYKTSYWAWRLKQVGQRVLQTHKDSRWNYKILVLIILIFKKTTTLIHTTTPNYFGEIWLSVCGRYTRKEKFNR